MFFILQHCQEPQYSQDWTERAPVTSSPRGPGVLHNLPSVSPCYGGIACHNETSFLVLGSEARTSNSANGFCGHL